MPIQTIRTPVKIAREIVQVNPRPRLNRLSGVTDPRPKLDHGFIRNEVLQGNLVASRDRFDRRQGDRVAAPEAFDRSGCRVVDHRGNVVSWVDFETTSGHVCRRDNGIGTRS